MLKFLVRDEDVSEKGLAQTSKVVDPESRSADIGTGHAYLSIALVKEGEIDFTITGDVAAGPLNNAKQDVEGTGSEEKTEVRLDSGLAALRMEDQIDTVVVASMSGKLTISSLETAYRKGKAYPTLVLETNTGGHLVRKWSTGHQYGIVAEQIIEVAGHIYEIVKTVQGKNKVKLSEEDLVFGSFLLKQKNLTFFKKRTNQSKYCQNLKTNLSKAKSRDENKINKINDLIKVIKEVLK